MNGGKDRLLQPEKLMRLIGGVRRRHLPARLDQWAVQVGGEEERAELGIAATGTTMTYKRRTVNLQSKPMMREWSFEVATVQRLRGGARLRKME